MPVPFTEAPLECSVGAHHWVAAMNDLGDYYEVCLGCGKQTAWTPLGETPPGLEAAS